MRRNRLQFFFGGGGSGTNNAARCILYSSLRGGLRVFVHLSAIFVAVLCFEGGTVSMPGAVSSCSRTPLIISTRFSLLCQGGLRSDSPGCGLATNRLCCVLCMGVREKGRTLEKYGAKLLRGRGRPSHAREHDMVLCLCVSEWHPHRAGQSFIIPLVSGLTLHTYSSDYGVREGSGHAKNSLKPIVSHKPQYGILRSIICISNGRDKPCLLSLIRTFHLNNLS